VKRTIALMLILSLVVFGFAATADALILLGEDAPDGVGVEDEEVVEDATVEEDPGVDCEEVVEDATPDEKEAPAESGGWMKIM